MAWVTIPNEVVRSFTGLPLKGQKLNDDLEYVFKPIRCPSEGCGFSTVLLAAYQEHIATHPASPDLNTRAEPEMVERTAAWLILEFLLMLGRADNPQRPNPLRRLQRPNDGMHSSEVWRRAWNCREGQEIKLKKDQYDWLHQVLDRKMPVERERKELGEEAQTVASYMFGLSEDAIRQALTTLPDRRKIMEGDSLA